jgi:uncharacterized Tic20 family protein
MSENSAENSADRRPDEPSTGPPPTAMSPYDERLWATLAHVGSFVLAWVAIGVVAPVIVLVLYGNKSAYVRHHAVESINFQLTMLIAIAVSAFLLLVLIGFVLLPLVAVWYVIFVIVASVHANHGDWYRYPATLRLVR